MNPTVKRTIFGVLFLAVMLGGLLFNRIVFIILFSLISYIMLGEFYRMTMGSSYRALQDFAGCMGASLVWIAGSCLYRGESLSETFFPCLFILTGAIMIWSIFQKDHKDFLKTGYLYAGLLYIGIPVALSNVVVYSNGTFSGLLMVAFFVIIWASDTGAYCFGMLLGQKIWPAKLCPSISPKKSWAGFTGGLLTSVLAGAILYWTGLFTFPIWHCLIVAAIMSVAGVFGDLFESLWKRAAGIKDSGNLIPGHGGLMDRFDSALFAIPAGYIYLLYFNLL